MTDVYHRRYDTRRKAVAYYQYRTSPSGRVTVDIETNAICLIDRKAGGSFFKRKQILEIGIGGGVISRGLRARIPNLRVVGVDASKGMLSVLKDNLDAGLPREDTDLIAADIYRLPFLPSTFDSTVMIRLLTHLSNKASALREVAQIMRPGGLVIFDFYNAMSVLSLRDRLCKIRSPDYAGADSNDLCLVRRVSISAGFSILLQGGCFILGETFLKFVPKRLLPIAVLTDRILSNLPFFSSFPTRMFILAQKKQD